MANLENDFISPIIYTWPGLAYLYIDLQNDFNSPIIYTWTLLT